MEQILKNHLGSLFKILISDCYPKRYINLMGLGEGPVSVQMKSSPKCFCSPTRLKRPFLSKVRSLHIPTRKASFYQCTIPSDEDNGFVD